MRFLFINFHVMIMEFSFGGTVLGVLQDASNTSPYKQKQPFSHKHFLFPILPIELYLSYGWIRFSVYIMMTM